MSKKRFHMRPEYAVDSRTVVYKVENTNCDTLVGQIKTFYEKCEPFITLEDKQRLLTVLVRINQCKRCVERTEKDSMYRTFYTIRNKYRSKAR